MRLNNAFCALNFDAVQRRIFIFEALVGYWKLGALLEGLRRLMSYKLSQHVLVTSTEQVVPLHKHITLFWISLISGTKTVTKKAAVKLSDHTPVTYLLSTSLAWCNLKNGFRRFLPHIIRSRWRTQKLFIGGFIQWLMVVICIWCAWFVTSQFDVIHVSKPTFWRSLLT